LSVFRGYCAYDLLPEQRGIFVHNPRTGGTTITRHLGPLAPRMILAHGTSEFVRTTIGKGNWNHFFKFGFVRNPWEKHVSWYIYCTKRLGMKLPSFDDVVKKNILAVVHKGSIDWVTRGYWSQKIFFTEQGTDEVIVDFIGQYENFNDDFGHVCEKLGFNKNFKHLNESLIPYDFREYYNDVTAQSIKHKCAWEIEKFGYKFERA